MREGGCRDLYFRWPGCDSEKHDNECGYVQHNCYDNGHHAGMNTYMKQADLTVK